LIKVIINKNGLSKKFRECLLGNWFKA